jgi:hypothetical protein
VPDVRVPLREKFKISESKTGKFRNFTIYLWTILISWRTQTWSYDCIKYATTIRYLTYMYVYIYIYIYIYIYDTSVRSIGACSLMRSSGFAFRGVAAENP